MNLAGGGEDEDEMHHLLTCVAAPQVKTNTQFDRNCFPKMWKQVLVWALNTILIVAVGVAWVLVGNRQALG